MPGHVPDHGNDESEVLGAGEARLAAAGDSGGAGGDHDFAVRVRPVPPVWPLLRRGSLVRGLHGSRAGRDAQSSGQHGRHL
ncbi:hypothetical protein D3C75_1098830 [compost metagenome]